MVLLVIISSLHSTVAIRKWNWFGGSNSSSNSNDVSSGACGLIRQYTLNLTLFLIVLHGCLGLSSDSIFSILDRYSILLQALMTMWSGLLTCYNGFC